MQLLVLLLPFIGALGIWYFRAKAARDAADEIFDAAGRIKGKIKRKRFLKKVDAATLDSITDPRIAAAVVVVAIARSDSGELSQEQEAVLQAQLASVAGVDNPIEEITFAKWATKDMQDLHTLNRRLLPVLAGNLGMRQRGELVAMVQEVANADRDVSAIQSQAIDNLKRRLAASS